MIKKANQLGFPGLTEQSSPQELGEAIIQHWNEKILTSQSLQRVINSYEGILLKNIQGTEYVYCEYELEPLDSTTFSWAWTVNKISGKQGVGLQGNIAGKTDLVWYKNQKQLFKARTILTNAVRINIERIRLILERYVTTILAALQSQINNPFFDNNSDANI